MKLRLLDLFCGAGGCAAGYTRAGFEVHGVDVRPQPRYLLSGPAPSPRPMPWSTCGGMAGSMT